MDEGVRRVTELEVRREAKGLSWTGLGVALGLCHEDGAGFDVRTPKSWEALTHGPSRACRQKLCRYFEVGSVAELGLGCGLEAARYRVWMTEDERNAEVRRRGFCIATGAAVGAALLPVSKLVAGAQLLDRAGRIGAVDVGFATEAATHLASTYAATPDADAVRAARVHAFTLLDWLDHATMSLQTRAGLEAVACDASCLAGYGDLNAGRLVEAKRWFDKALELAHQAGDRSLEAYALTAIASMAANESDPDHAAAVVDLEAAAELQRFLRPAGRAWVFAVLAEQHAALGHDLVSGRFLELARAAAALVHYEEAGWGWWSTGAQLSGWDGVRPQIFTGIRALSLGRPAEALELFDGALDGVSMPARRVGLHEDVMSACVALGDPERACASAHASLDEARAYKLRISPMLIRKARATFPG
ncbi:MAG: hypothetical protein ACRD0K_29810, partial [Egibacteraceae bacterium]